MISRPHGTDQAEFDYNDDNLLIVPGGRVFVLYLDFRAFSPIEEVLINGLRQTVPKITRYTLRKTHFLKPGKNEIVVTAAIKDRTVSKTFEILLHKPPGTP